MKIAFIGGGNMGEAMLSAVIIRNIATPEEVTVSDVNEDRLRIIREKYKVNTTTGNLQAIINADIIIMAIKPQTLAGVMAELKGSLKSGQLVLSIIAGARIGTLSQGLGMDCIVRSMPNTPAQIGEGMTVWTATPAVNVRQKEWARAILGAMGKQIAVDDEKYLDMATAVSGSGPAYLFLFIEAQIEAGVSIGLAPDIAEQLVLQTITGAAHLLEKSGRKPSELRKMVTSPGGTTAAALGEFEKGDFISLVKKAVTAAFNRAKELGS